MNLGYRELALLKTRVLIHDPPNKSFLLKTLGVEFGDKHRDVARQFVATVLRNTTLGGIGLAAQFESIISEADRIASTFDRWVFRAADWPSKSYVYYNRIHNLFSPEVSIELGNPPGNDGLFDVAGRLNEILVAVDRLTDAVQERELLLYNSLYTLLEPTWYALGFPPSLADTRTPTHTTFDHLYASATIVNMLLNGGPDGFYVILDFPGIQRFVNAGRKAGDIWASSWLLSNLMWSLAEYFMNTYGYDVLVSPTPRLNPYTLRTLISRLLGLSGREYELITGLEDAIRGADDKLRDAIDRILKIYTRLYGVDSVQGLQTLWLQPLIPATITLVLPKKISNGQALETEDRLAEVVDNIFRESWRSIVDFTESRLASSSNPLYLALGNTIKSLGDVLDVPPQGLNIAIVRIEDVYRAISECVVNRDRRLCSELGLNIDFDALFHMVKKEELELLARSLLWHVLATRSGVLARIDRYGKMYSSIPRPFWVYSGGLLKTIDSAFEKFSAGWTPCSLCGYEPAYIVLRKGVKSSNRLTFREEDLNEFLSIAGIQSQEDRERVSHDINYIFKPGEAVGPYCLLKRALYIGFRDRLEVMSTDDVALSAISSLLSRPDLSKILAGGVPEATGITKDELEYLFTPPDAIARSGRRRPFKDIYALATLLGKGYEDLVNRITSYLVDSCRESGVEARNLLDAIAQTIGIPAGSASNLATYSLISSLVESGKVGTDSLCQFLGLRTRYAIVRGDADDIGKIIGGQKLCEVSEYRKHIVELIRRGGEAIGYSDVFKYLEQGYESAEKIVKALGLRSLPLSPAAHQSISLSLMLTAISDYRIVREGGGILIYSGGDDVTALLPVETAINTVLRLREEFYSSGFKRVGGIPIASAIPTGRSFSIRIADIMDVMSAEMYSAMKLLEEKAKKASWIYTIENTPRRFSKDTLVISSSRSGVEALFPVKLDGTPILAILRETPLLLLTVLSKNIPEDYHRLVEELEEHIDSDSLYRLSTYIVERNVKLSDESRKSIVSELQKVLKIFANLSLAIGDRRSTSIWEYVKFIAIARVWI